MKKTAYITGILGQDGAYLSKLLLEKDYAIYGLIRRHARPDFDNTDYLGVTKEIEFVTGDMTDSASLMQHMKSVRPSEVYNLAAQSFVGASWQLASYTTDVNASGTLHLLEALRMHAPATRFYQASTSEMFGLSGHGGAQDEETPFHPRSPYAIAKLYAHWMARNYVESYGLFCASGILFNHESPIRGKEFVTRKITDGVARIKLGLADTISLGNLDAKRDWGFAGDYVEAMWRMLQHDKPETFVISTGRTHSIRDFLDAAFRHVGIEDWSGHVQIDPRFKRPAEIHELRGNSAKAERELDWKPDVDFEHLVRMMVDADLARHGQPVLAAV